MGIFNKSIELLTMNKILIALCFATILTTISTRQILVMLGEEEVGDRRKSHVLLDEDGERRKSHVLLDEEVGDRLKSKLKQALLLLQGPKYLSIDRRRSVDLSPWQEGKDCVEKNVLRTEDGGKCSTLGHYCGEGLKCRNRLGYENYCVPISREDLTSIDEDRSFERYTESLAKCCAWLKENGESNDKCSRL